MATESSKKSFLIYYDNEVIVLRLTDEDAGKLFKSLFPYGRKKIKPNFEESPALAMAFDILSMAIDRDNDKYVKRCEKNRENIEKRWKNKPKQSNTNVYGSNQSNTNYTDMDKDRDMDRDMDMDSINYQQIADMYNDICISFPRMMKLSDSRKKAIRARMKTYSVDDFRKMFELAESSSFLKGQNDRDWSANFDWMVKDANMAKILDGNYQDKKKEGDDNGKQSGETRRPASDYYRKLLGNWNSD